VQNHPAL